MFCKQCMQLSTDESCRASSHTVVPMSQISSELQVLTEQGGTLLDKIRSQREQIKCFYAELHSVFQSAERCIASRIASLDTDVQLDTALSDEMCRLREEVCKCSEACPQSLAERYVETRACVADSIPVLRQLCTLTQLINKSRHTQAHIIAVSQDSLGSGSSQDHLVQLPLAEDLRSSSLSRSAMAAAIVAFSIEAFGSSDKAIGSVCSSSNNCAYDPVLAELGSVMNELCVDPAPQESHSRQTPVCSVANHLPSTGVTSSAASAVTANCDSHQSQTFLSAARKAETLAPTRFIVPYRNTQARADKPLYGMEVKLFDNIHRVTIELRCDLAPKLCKNFMALCDSGKYNYTRFNFAVSNDQLHGGRISVDGMLAKAALPESNRNDGLMIADTSPLADAYGAIRMKGCGTATVAGKLRCLVGSQFLFWLSKTRQYTSANHTVVFGRVLDGLDVLSTVSTLSKSELLGKVVLLKLSRLSA